MPELNTCQRCSTLLQQRDELREALGRIETFAAMIAGPNDTLEMAKANARTIQRVARESVRSAL